MTPIRMPSSIIGKAGSFKTLRVRRIVFVTAQTVLLSTLIVARSDALVDTE